MSSYNLLLASDRNYMCYCFVTCQSVIDAIHYESKEDVANNRDKIIFNILVDETVDQTELNQKCESFIARNTSCVDISFNIKTASNEPLKNAPTLNGSLLTYYRIFLDNLFDDDINLCLYLDCDVIVRKDIRPLFNETDMAGFVLGAVPDFCAEEDSQQIGLMRVPERNKKVPALTIPLTNYFNAGVILFNINEYRNKNISKKCMELLVNYSPNHHDQDLLNITVPASLRKVLEPKWNTHLYMGLLSYNSKSSDYSLLATRNATSPRRQTVSTTLSPDVFINEINDPCIFHYIYMKPWDNLKFSFTNLPSTSTMSLRIKEWFDTAEKVIEFSNELSKAKYSPLYTHSYEICAFNERINNLQIEISKQRSRRKKDRKILLLTIVLLFIIQLVLLLCLTQ